MHQTFSMDLGARNSIKLGENWLVYRLFPSVPLRFCPFVYPFETRRAPTATLSKQFREEEAPVATAVASGLCQIFSNRNARHRVESGGSWVPR